MGEMIELSEETRRLLIGVQRQLVSDWSEAHWCAGWLLGIEQKAWDGAAFGEFGVYDPDVVAIHELARLTGVWCEYERDVPLDAWQEQHGPPLTRMADPEPTPEQQAALQREQDRLTAHWQHLGLLPEGDDTVHSPPT